MANQGLFAALLLSLVIAEPLIAQAPQPVAQSWTGWAQCQITIQAPGYSHRETHLWTVTGAGTRNANMEIYPTSWTVTGDGSLQRVNGPTMVSAQWTVTGTLQNVTIGTTLHLDRITVQRWTNHGPARSGLTGTEISTTNGVARSRSVVLDVQQWAFPVTETATTSTRATGSNSLPFDGLRGPMNPPSGATGTATCSWDFARGGSTAAPPPATTPALPTSGGNVSGGVPSGGAGGSAPPTGTTAGSGAGSVNPGTPGTATPTTPGGSAGGAASGGGGSADLGSGVSLRAVPPYVAPANGTVLYDISIWNSGPSAANGAMLKVSASAGPSNWSNFVCFTSQGPAPVPCPSGIAAGTIQSGMAIPSLPPNTGFKVWFDAAVPGTVGSNLSVAATINPPAGVTDTNPGNNSNTLTFPIVAPASGGGGASAGGGAGSGGVNFRAFTTSGGFVVPAGVTTIGIELWGAGGGGAAGASGGFGGAFSGGVPVGGAGGGGGGSGAFLRTTLTVTPGASYNVVIGAGGNAGGGNGGTTEFRQGSTLLASAAGGSGGAGTAGGAGGVSTPGAVLARNGLSGNSAGALPPPTGDCTKGPPCQVGQSGAPGGAGGGPTNGSVVPVGTTGGVGGSGGGATRIVVTVSQHIANASPGGTGTPGEPGYALITW